MVYAWLSTAEMNFNHHCEAIASFSCQLPRKQELKYKNGKAFRLFSPICPQLVEV